MVWEPPSTVSREEILEISAGYERATPADVEVTERVYEVDALGLPWDVAGNVYTPSDGDVARGADGREVGIFVLHGGGADHREFDGFARLLAGHKRFKVATMTYPGHFWFEGDHVWPGDTVEPDGAVRVPRYTRDEVIGQDEFELVTDASDEKNRAKYGTLFFLKAREGSRLYDRLASWPGAYEQAIATVMGENFPEESFSVYASGHSTGGPMTHMMLQRVPNVVGLVGAESSPYGAIFSKMLDQPWDYPFNWCTVRTWRDVARYAGAEAGPEGCRRLPWLMEEVFEKWDEWRKQSGLKAQQLIQFAAVGALEQGALATAKRLGMSQAATDELVDKFTGYPFPLQGEGLRPVPPLLYLINKYSRDHTYEVYSKVLMPELAKIDPAPKARIVRLEEGTHFYYEPEEGLPFGVAPAIADIWERAIANGYYTGPDA
jgi:hypothetical protein